MPDRHLDLDKTTQTDLLYGLAREQESNVAVLDDALHEPDADRAITQQAATRTDISLAARIQGDHDGGERLGTRWRYLDGWSPPERKGASTDGLPKITVPRRSWTLRRVSNALWRGSSSWLISFSIHLVLLPVLALFGYPQAAPTPIVIYRGTTAAAPIPLDDVEITISAMLPAHFDGMSHPVHFELALPEPRVDRGAMTGLLADAAIVPIAARSAGPVSDILGLTAEKGRGKAAAGDGSGGAKFFGTVAAGRSFVFVVDCSLSMLEEGRWSVAMQELCASIDRLKPEQLFYVILFDGGVHRMFNHDEREAALFPATDENKLRFQQWLATARLGPDTFPFLAVRSAWALQPDAIYLLSDGEFKDSTENFLKKFNRPVDHLRRPRRQVIVHTLGFHKQTYAGERVLKRIAADNNGAYQFVPRK